MSDFKTILCPTDFSEYSEYAMRYATAFAKISDGTIHCVHVVDMGFATGAGVDGVYVSGADLQRSLKSIQAHAEEQLEHFVRKEHFLGAEVTPHLCTGHAAEEIAKMAEEIGADLIVTATHGRSGLERMMFGGTCDKLLRLSKVPVLAIKHPEHEALDAEGSLSIDKIMCPVDFSEFSHSALPVAEELARRFGASITLAHVVNVQYDYPEWTAQTSVNASEHIAASAKENLDKLASKIEGIETDVVVETGVPHRTLVDEIENRDIDLVVMPTHGRRRLSHALLGSVAERVTRGADCPVLTIRPTG